MKDFICILVCFFIILCFFMVMVYYTGAFWVKVFKFVYRFSGRYWFFMWMVLLCILIIGNLRKLCYLIMGY